MNRAPLLVELFCEELPPRALLRLGESFGATLKAELQALDLIDASADCAVFAAPRHLAARIDAVADHAQPRTETLKGPSVKVGLDAQGEPTVALRKWAEKQGVPLSDLRQANDGKQQVFVAERTQPGATLVESIDAVVSAAIAALPVPKTMQYQLADGHTTVSFVRPAHRLLVLHGAKVLPAQVLGLAADRLTEGHRFLSQGTLSIADASVYESALERAHVLVSFAARRARIEEQLRTRARALDLDLGAPQPLAALLDEVTALVEWPAVYAGTFEERFLAVPPECLILTMRTNQKYFPLFDAKGRLANRFLIVSNMEVDDPSQIVDGNERVVRPRLADAQFFYEQDRRTPLAQRVARLESVVYHARLGTQAQRMARVRAIAIDIAALLRLDQDVSGWCARAATLAKADLLTGMVGEFPELQGVMGTYYAHHDGEPEAVATALAEQYRPRFAGDDLPASTTGTVLALADKLETLMGLFSIGQLPTGDKDPFALRRHALGVVRILLEKSLPLTLPDAIAAAKRACGADDAAAEQLIQFVHERLAGYLRDQGHAANSVAAVLDTEPALLAPIPARLAAVAAFARLPQAQALAAANKRIGNILRKTDALEAGTWDPALVEQPAEAELAAVVAQLDAVVTDAVERNEFERAMREMAAVREPVDRFFDHVMVMADDPLRRDNRLRLLQRLHGLMNRVADISRLAT